MSKRSPEDRSISKERISKICQQLAEGKAVSCPLPMDGFLHIDRKLPFICLYRRPPKRRDLGTERLVTAEASYLVASGSRGFKPGLSALIQEIAKTLADEFKAFLIIEIWSANIESQVAGMNTNGLPGVKPHFRIIGAKIHPPILTIKFLEKALKEIRILKKYAAVEVTYDQQRWPQDLLPPVSRGKIRKFNYYIIGVEVRPVYRDEASGEVFPLVLRQLHRGVAQALKKALYQFSYTQTLHRAVNYQALGRQAIVKAVWEMDRRLAEISNAFDFLLQVTPVNIDLAWAEFRKHHCERRPVLYYRPLPIDVSLLKRRLYQIPLEHLEDPTLSFLFREKRVEIDRQLAMLRDRDTRNFLYGSLQLYGGVSNVLLKLTIQMLKEIPPRSREESPGVYSSAAEFAERARAEFQYYRRGYPQMSARAEVRDDIVGLMVSRGNLLIGHRTQIPLSRVEALISHEVGTHVLTYFNGFAQPFQQLYTGLAGYDELQEGLAVLAEYLVGGLSPPRLRLLAGRVIAAHCLIDGASFIDTYRELNRTYGFEQETAFTITLRIYRGGGLTKDAIYLRGLVSVLKYLEEGGQIEPLFVGKIAASHIPIIYELQSRQILRPAPLRPRYMDRSETSRKLAGLRGGFSVLDLLDKEKMGKTEVA